MKPPGDCRPGQAGLVQEETPEHSPQPHRACAVTELTSPTTPVVFVYYKQYSHGVYLGDHTYCMPAEIPTEDEESSIKTEMIDKDAACEERQGMLQGGVMSVSVDVIRVKEEPECQQHAAGEAPGAGAPCQREEEDDPPVVMVPERKEVVRLKEEPPVYWSEIKGEGCSGVSEAAMRANLYANHIIKDELVLGPEHLHRPTLLPSPLDPTYVAPYEQRDALARCSWDRTNAATGSAAEGGRAVSSDTGVVEALGRRCSVRLERLLLDAERRACRVGRRTHRLRPESEPRRAATPATDTYRCHHCDKAFGHKSVLSEHLHTHLSTRLAHSRSTREDSNLDQHQNLDTGLKGNLQRHVSTHTRDKPFQCNYCDYKCSRKRYLRNHEMKHTGVKPYQCDYCDHKCTQKGNLRIHEMTHTGVKPYQCNYCDFKCSQKGHLRRHEMTHTGVKPFQCDYCDYKCTVKGSLRIHEVTHTGVKPYQCNYCDYKCSLKGHLRRHEMIHTGVKPFQCDNCDFKCTLKESLRLHEMTHTGVMPYQCNCCDYKCSQKGSLRMHERTHTGVKPFQCDYCDYKFSQKGHLRRHEMTHTGVKPFQCDNCDYKCTVKESLRIHKVTHTGVKPYQCNYCDYKCSLKKRLKRHEKTHTAKEPSRKTRVL